MTNNLTIAQHGDQFDAGLFDNLKRFDEQGTEYWSARELMATLGYVKWQMFKNVIDIAKENLETVVESTSNHFLLREVKSGGRPLLDYSLSATAVKLTLNYVDSRTLNPRIKKRSEKSIKDILAKSILGAKTEVRTLAGNIDILSSIEIIEVKRIENWKGAIGQILVYGHYYPSHQKRIHLYGETQETFLGLIRLHCEKFNVIVTWEV